MPRLSNGGKLSRPHNGEYFDTAVGAEAHGIFLSHYLTKTLELDAEFGHAKVEVSLPNLICYGPIPKLRHYLVNKILE